MIHVGILEPKTCAQSDYWYCLANRKTYCLQNNYTWADYTTILRTTGFAPVAIARTGSVVIPINDPDNVPFEWDNTRHAWVPVVPKGFGFPPLNPHANAVWSDTKDIYMYSGTHWAYVAPVVSASSSVVSQQTTQIHAGMLSGSIQIWSPPAGTNRGLVLDLEEEDEEQDTYDAYDRAMKGIGK